MSENKSWQEWTDPQGSQPPEIKNVWHDPPDLIARSQVACFPPKCVVCGDEPEGDLLKCAIRVKRPLRGFGFFYSPTVTLELPVCEVHRKQELHARWIGYGIAFVTYGLIMIPLIVISVIKQNPEIVLLTPVATIVGTMLLIAHVAGRKRLLWAKRIRSNYARIGDVPVAVLQLLPPWPPKQG